MHHDDVVGDGDSVGGDGVVGGDCDSVGDGDIVGGDGGVGGDECRGRQEYWDKLLVVDFSIKN